MNGVGGCRHPRRVSSFIKSGPGVCFLGPQFIPSHDPSHSKCEMGSLVFCYLHLVMLISDFELPDPGPSALFLSSLWDYRFYYLPRFPFLFLFLVCS